MGINDNRQKSMRGVKRTRPLLIALIGVLVLFCLVATVDSGLLGLHVSKGVVFHSATLNATAGENFVCNYVNITSSNVTINFNIPMSIRSVPVGLPYSQYGNNVIIIINGTGNYTFYFTGAGVYFPTTLLYYIIFLLIVLIPTLAFYEYLGRIAVIPTIVLMSTICFFGGLIPLSLYILILIVGIAILIMERRGTNNG